jgi:dGTP triphosphohydrolase
MQLSDLDVYERICVPRFATIEKNQEKLADDVHEIREKLFNGMDKSIVTIEKTLVDMATDQKQRKRSRALWARDLILTLLGSGGIMSLILMRVIQ